MGIKITIKIDDENVRTKELSEGDDRVHVSCYARFLDEDCKCPYWGDSEGSLLWLKELEAYANARLKLQGYLFLNDVYETLGIPRSKAGQVVGWTYDEGNPMGDNYVDFGIYQKHNAGFINGYERKLLLDFNVDGVILDKIP